jgi:hypothetical protein
MGAAFKKVAQDECFAAMGGIAPGSMVMVAAVTVHINPATNDPTILDAKNVATVVRVGTSEYTITFSNPLKAEQANWIGMYTPQVFDRTHYNLLFTEWAKDVNGVTVVVARDEGDYPTGRNWEFTFVAYAEPDLTIAPAPNHSRVGGWTGGVGQSLRV